MKRCHIRGQPRTGYGPPAVLHQGHCHKQCTPSVSHEWQLGLSSLVRGRAHRLVLALLFVDVLCWLSTSPASGTAMSAPMLNCMRPRAAA
mmetsp:Transcript_77217/g.208540  ORF Transcript_77217/g.208540 Transcript_77217/m.208540 type:complete len:90 (-) Transcript_77217:97-366(-)